MLYYLDMGLVSLPSDTWASSQDGELTTTSSTCSQCAARLATSGQRDDETQGHGGTADSDSAGTGTSDWNKDCHLPHSHILLLLPPLGCVSNHLCICYYLESRSVSRHRRFEKERGMGESRGRSSKIDRRFRRLEKTVESLSHGLILALTQLKSGDISPDTEPHCPHHRPGHPDVANDGIGSVSEGHSVDGDDGDLSTVFARLGFTENCTESFIFMLVALDY